LTINKEGTVSVLSENHNYIEELPVGGVPRRGPELNAFGLAESLTSDANGDLFVGDDVAGEGLIQEIRPGGEPETLPPTGLRRVEGMAVDAAGDVFAVGEGANAVVELIAGGGRRELSIVGIAPQAVTAGPTGSLIVGDHATSGAGLSQIVEVPLEGAPRVIIQPYMLDDSALEIAGLAFDPEGNLFIAAIGEDSLFALPVGGEVPLELDIEGPGTYEDDGPIALAVDELGDLYVAYEGEGEVNNTGYVVEVPAAFGHGLGPTPVVTGVTPAYGREEGGTTVEITGTHLYDATGVEFGDVPARNFVVDSPSLIVAEAPAGSNTVDVTVTAPPGTSEVTATDRFTFVPVGSAPVIKRLSAKTGPAAGGKTITITGTRFVGVTEVQFGGQKASSFVVNNTQSISAVSPPGTAGAVYVSVTTPNGTSAATSKAGFKYERPTITMLSPDMGTSTGGTVVSITGTGFAPGADGTMFEFGRLAAYSVVCETITRCTAVAPGVNKPSTVDVRAIVGKAESQKTPATDQYSYQGS
jgi:hypothetical protein